MNADELAVIEGNVKHFAAGNIKVQDLLKLVDEDIPCLLAAIKERDERIEELESEKRELTEEAKPGCFNDDDMTECRWVTSTDDCRFKDCKWYPEEVKPIDIHNEHVRAQYGF